MKVLLPNNETHTIKLIPRYTPTGVLSLKLTKEGYNEITEQVPTYTITNGVMSLTFDLVGVKQDRYVAELSKGSDIVSRFDLFFTDQNTQDFKLTKDTFIYV